MRSASTLEYSTFFRRVKNHRFSGQPIDLRPQSPPLVGLGESGGIGRYFAPWQNERILHGRIQLFDCANTLFDPRWVEVFLGKVLELPVSSVS